MALHWRWQPRIVRGFIHARPSFYGSLVLRANCPALWPYRESSIGGQTALISLLILCPLAAASVEALNAPTLLSLHSIACGLRDGLPMASSFVRMRLSMSIDCYPAMDSRRKSERILSPSDVI